MSTQAKQLSLSTIGLGCRMETWMIVALIAAVAIVIYFVMRRKVLPVPPQPVPVQQEPAPGVSPASGHVETAPTLPTPPDVAGPSRIAKIRATVTPSAQLQHIPIVGNAAVQIARAPINLSFKAADKINNTLSNIPVAGKVLAAPGKVATKALKSISSWF
jgi:hypothetical protein